MASRIRLQLLDTKGMGAHETFLSPKLQQARRISLITLTILFCAAFVTSVALLAFTAPFHLGPLWIPTVVCGGALLLTFGLFSAINYQKKNAMVRHLRTDKKEELARHLRKDQILRFSAYLSKNGKDILFLVQTGYLTSEEGEKLTKLVERYRCHTRQLDAFTKAYSNLLFTDDEKYFECHHKVLEIDTKEYPKFIEKLELWKANPNFK